MWYSKHGNLNYEQKQLRKKLLSPRVILQSLCSSWSGSQHSEYLNTKKRQLYSVAKKATSRKCLKNIFIDIHFIFPSCLVLNIRVLTYKSSFQKHFSTHSFVQDSLKEGCYFGNFWLLKNLNEKRDWSTKLQLQVLKRSWVNMKFEQDETESTCLSKIKVGSLSISNSPYCALMWTADLILDWGWDKEGHNGLGWAGPCLPRDLTCFLGLQYRRRGVVCFLIIVDVLCLWGGKEQEDGI